MIDTTTVRPLSNWAQKVNEIVRKNKFTIKGILPHFYYDNKFNYSLIIIFNDDFAVTITNNKVSEVQDLRMLLGISFNNNIFGNFWECSNVKALIYI